MRDYTQVSNSDLLWNLATNGDRCVGEAEARDYEAACKELDRRLKAWLESPIPCLAVPMPAGE